MDNLDNLYNDVTFEYDNNGRPIMSKTKHDFIKYYYDEYDRINYEECFTIYGELLRKIWFYYHPDGYLNHIVSDDGLYSMWIDEDGNETESQL